MIHDDPTPPKGEPVYENQRHLPFGRRASDKCPHEAKFKTWTGSTHIIVHYLVASAAISVLVLTFQVWKTLKHLDTQTGFLAPIMQKQNVILEDIHQGVHSEGQQTREALKEKK